MKGEALITVKDKDGNVKKQVKETNTVFDIPKEIIKETLQNIDVGEVNGVNYTTPPNDHITNFVANPISYAMAYDMWFRSIYINDENTSEVDYKDWKMPVLFGGEYSSQNTSNKRYAYYDTASSSRNDNKLKKVYIWTNCPAFSLKSINLKNERNSYTDASIFSNFIPAKYCLRNYGQYYYRPGDGYTYQSMLNGTVLNNTLYTKSNFEWSYSGGIRRFNGIQIATRKTSASGNAKTSPIFSLKDNEICLLSNLQYTTSILESTSDQIKYVNIINANTGEVKRSFVLTQFDGFVGYNSTNHYQNLTSIRIVATDFGNFIMMPKTTGSPYQFYLWQIPDTQTSETIPLYLTNPLNASSSYSMGSYIPNTIILNQYIFFLYNSSNTDKKTIRLNDVSQITNPTDADKITEYDYVPFNITANGYYSTNGQDYATLSQYSKYYKQIWVATTGWETWYNTTALNLAEPVAIAEGDTLTVEYTITAS